MVKLEISLRIFEVTDPSAGTGRITFHCSAIVWRCQTLGLDRAADQGSGDPSIRYLCKWNAISVGIARDVEVKMASTDCSFLCTGCGDTERVKE